MYTMDGWTKEVDLGGSFVWLGLAPLGVRVQVLVVIAVDCGPPVELDWISGGPSLGLGAASG